MPMYDSIASASSRAWYPDIGTWLIISMPPASTTSAMPLMICMAPFAMVWSPLEQNLLIVWPGTSTGNPARSALSRATFNPCAASGMAHPHATSSMIAGFTPTRVTASFMSMADNSMGCVPDSAPPILPLATAERTAETSTTSLLVSGILVILVRSGGKRLRRSTNSSTACQSSTCSLSAPASPSFRVTAGMPHARGRGCPAPSPRAADRPRRTTRTPTRVQSAPRAR